MSDLVYKFSFPLSAVGADISINDRAGTSVDTGTLDLSMVEDGRAVLRSTLPEGSYLAVGVDTPGVGSQPGELDEPRSIAAGSGAGASETAHFIGTATADTSGDQFALTFEQHPDYDAVDWATIDSGNIAVTGPVIVPQMLYRFGATLDFTDATGFSTATTAPNVDATIKFSRDGAGLVNAGGPYAEVPVDTPGVSFELDAVEEGFTQAVRCSANSLLTISGQVNAQGFDEAGDPVTDGVLTGAVAIWITRATLPTIPA